MRPAPTIAAVGMGVPPFLIHSTLHFSIRLSRKSYLVGSWDLWRSTGRCYLL